MAKVSGLSKEGQNMLLMAGFSSELIELLKKYGIKTVRTSGKKIVFEGETEESGVWFDGIDANEPDNICIGFKLPKKRKKE